MGKKKGGEAAREFAIEVPMHCRCIGCRKKLRDAVRGLRLAAGVLTVRQSSAAEDAEELTLLATADPELLRQIVQDVMGGKKVHLVFPPNKDRSSAGAGSSEKDDPRLVDAAALQALVDDLQRQAPQPGRRHHDGHGTADHHHHYHQPPPEPEWNSDGTAYPWLPSYYPGPPAPAWEAPGAYGYPAQAAAAHGYYYYPPNAPPCPAGLDY